MSWGPLIHGHAPKGLVKALGAAAARGTSFGAPTQLETRLARQVAMLMPSMERVRFVSSGTEATMSAARVARAFTKRDKIVKFEGCYHGHADSFPRAGRIGRDDARRADQPRRRRAARRATRWSRATTTSTSVERRLRSEPRRDRRGVRRADRRQHGRGPAAGRIPRRAAEDLRPRGQPAGVRRGDLRLPRRAGRRAAGLRRQAGPDLPGQDHRRRPAGRRVWRTRGCDGAGGAVGTGVSGGNAVGKSPGDDRGALVPERAVAEAVSPPREARRARWRPASPMRRARPACRCRSTRSARW